MAFKARTAFGLNNLPENTKFVPHTAFNVANNLPDLPLEHQRQDRGRKLLRKRESVSFGGRKHKRC